MMRICLLVTVIVDKLPVPDVLCNWSPDAIAFQKGRSSSLCVADSTIVPSCKGWTDQFNPDTIGVGAGVGAGVVGAGVVGAGVVGAGVGADTSRVSATTVPSA